MASPDHYSPVSLTRDCDVTLIPGGQRLRLHQGDRVVVTQALGGTFTVQTEEGYLARISAADADAIGRSVADLDTQAGAPEVAGSGPFDLDKVIDQLKTVYDPEIPVNVVDLGLIYDCRAEPLDGGGHRVEIKMSMTAPGCGMGDVLKDDAEARVQAIPGVTEVEVELVWDPPWDMGRMSEVARLELGLY